MTTASDNLWEYVRFNADGLISAIIIDDDTGDVLMQAWMNELALKTTLEQSILHYYSRSRQKLWRKGETSGNQQQLLEMHIDCDGDCLLIKVKQTGAACHTGTKTCFYRQVNLANQQLTEIASPIQDANDLYGKPSM